MKQNTKSLIGWTIFIIIFALIIWNGNRVQNGPDPVSNPYGTNCGVDNAQC